MFMLGTFMGIGVSRLNNTDQLSESIRIWEGINSEVLLLVFLPGLIFHDAYSLNVHLFQVSFGQCLLLAFPMVLAGTTLVACVAFYIFPYNWSFNLAMTFGSILAATDPVAVSALLNEVGAPPRLKMHISGESLLNDGELLSESSCFWCVYTPLHTLSHPSTTFQQVLLLCFTPSSVACSLLSSTQVLVKTSTSLKVLCFSSVCLLVVLALVLHLALG
jgi:NhaP-type Na+/H+ or K+/H+ antiporter